MQKMYLNTKKNTFIKFYIHIPSSGFNYFLYRVIESIEFSAYYSIFRDIYLFYNIRLSKLSLWNEIDILHLLLLAICYTRYIRGKSVTYICVCSMFMPDTFYINNIGAYDGISLDISLDFMLK